MRTHALLLSLIMATACGKKETPPEPSAKPIQIAAAAAPAKAPDALLKVIAAADSCVEDACEKATDALEEATKDLSPADFRGALAAAKKRGVRDQLISAAHDKLDDQAYADLVTAANGCPKEGNDCAALDDLRTAVSGMSPDRYRALAKLARTDDVKGALLSPMTSKLDPSLVPDMAAMATDEQWGRLARGALGSVENDAALKALIALLDDHSRTDTLHGDVPELLAKYPQNALVKAAVPKLQEMATKDKQGAGRERAAAALAAIEGKAAIPFLEQIAKNDSWDHTRAAATDLVAQLKAQK